MLYRLWRCSGASPTVDVCYHRAVDAPVKYVEELRSELSLYATWFPGDPVELGAYGTIVRGRFVTSGRLADLGIELVPMHHAQDQAIKKHRGMTLKAAAQTSANLGLIDTALGVDVEVAREHAWAFAARGVTKIEIGNIHEVCRGVLEAHRAGDWKREWLLVSELRRVEHLSVLIAQSRKLKGKIRASAKLPDPYDILLEEHASFELSTDDVFAVAGRKQTTPLYGLRKLKGFLDPELRAVSSGDGAELLQLEVANNEPLFG